MRREKNLFAQKFEQDFMATCFQLQENVRLHGKLFGPLYPHVPKEFVTIRYLKSVVLMRKVRAKRANRRRRQ